MKAIERLGLNEALERLLDRKRANFLEDHALQKKPALTWQCWPSDPLALDISKEELCEAMRAGGGPAAEDGWWQGFRFSSRPALTFDGLRSAGGNDSAGWATELHVDGYLAAGIWTFPEMGAQSAHPGLGVADFYANAFRDFVYLAGKVYEAAQYAAVVHVTSTMHHASSLSLMSGYDRVLAPAPNRITLRWPIATTDVARLADVGMAMAAQFMRVYGRKLPKS